MKVSQSCSRAEGSVIATLHPTASEVGPNIEHQRLGQTLSLMSERMIVCCGSQQRLCALTHVEGELVLVTVEQQCCLHPFTDAKSYLVVVAHQGAGMSD